MVSVGIDIGGTNLAAGVVNEQFELLTKVKCKASECPTPEAMVERLVRLSQEAVDLTGFPLTDVRAVGVGIPGAVDRETGMVLESVNTPFHQTPFVDLFQSHWYVPVYLENDANCAVLGEGVAGSARGARSVVAVTLGTGVGGGYLREGSLELYMRNGMEIGHTVIVPDGLPCPCGRRGCWEQYASATALKRMTREAMEAHPDSLMWELCGSPDKVKGRTAFDAKRAGDSAGTEVVERYLDYLDIGLSNLVNIFQPDLICIGGGVSHEKDEDFLFPLQERVDRHSLNKRLGNKTRLVTAALGGDAGILGAAALYREYIRR